MSELDRITEALIIRPGDTLLIRVAGTISRAQFDEYQDLVQREIGPKLPDVKVFLVNAEQLAVYRPDGAE